jgi:hypothetical protein
MALETGDLQSGREDAYISNGLAHAGATWGHPRCASRGLGSPSSPVRLPVALKMEMGGLAAPFLVY